ncbi:PREDICTED: methyl-CpG-binding domain-containing protein 9-like isoform X2 [Lupinus angustifolius]|uniref:methyl-CpG-binding domain-containing protein 9-like isoform X2 n=1 Tax=Lupinus angustifolius TaxID=3871 RepID=UPI00092E7307|nr:PREDICTED: methyl-CpG-binding domain-containing protein 9-like isoform X2 [Lupinus angustifolius]
MIMELTDSIAAANNHPPPPLQDSHSGLGIDLNEIPSPSTFETLQETIEIVRAFHDNPGPPPEGPALLPRGLTVCAACGKHGCSGVHAIVCDGCDRGFHVSCVGVHGDGRRIDEWLCADCVAGGVKSKLWPLGVKSKQLLDINASPPREADCQELQDLRKQTVGANPFGAPFAHSNLHNGSAFGFQKASGVVTHAVRVGFEDIINHNQSLTRSFEKGLRDFISERHGVLEEGWGVEFRQSVSGSEAYAVYCAPDGKVFDSLYEVACYLGLTSGYNSMECEIRNERSGSPQPSRKRKSTKMAVANGFAEKWGTFINSFCKDPPSNGLSVECATIGKATEAEIRRKEDGHSSPEQSSDGLPLQFKDFFVLSLGKVDSRPSYQGVNLICPVGYKSAWHDMITGSLFTCEVLEGGESGPIFRIRRCSCSKYPVPVGSTILSMSSRCQQFVSQTNKEGERRTNDEMDYDVDESIQMILSDPCVPTENDVISCIESCLNETRDTFTSDIPQLVAGSVQDKTRISLADDSGSVDGISEILVEDRSSSSAWEVMSQKLVNACKDICKQKGTLKFYCKHVENEACLHECDTRNGKSHSHFSSLDKFCASIGSVSIPDVVHTENDLDSFSEVLVKWLGQDRFGLDVEFVQEVLEKLPGVQDSLQYELLNSRNDNSSFPTVENCFLVVERRGGSQYQEEEVQGLYRKSKKARLIEKCVEEDRCPPPPGKPLCSRVPNEYIGDIFQAWELIERFHEILDLKEPLSLDELEKELIYPWFDGLDFLEKSERETNGSQVLNLPGDDSNCGSPRCEVGPSGSIESSHAFIQVDTEAMKEAAQVKLASFTYARCFGVALTKAHNSLLKVLISELQSNVAALVDPSFEPAETRSRRGRRKDIDSAAPAKRTKLNMLPNNELTWPELARRYILAVLSMDGNLDSAETIARESGKVFRCLRGDGGLLCGSLSGVAGMEADAQLLADATKKIFGSLSKFNDVITIEEVDSEVKDASENLVDGDGSIPEWAKELEPARKLPTNVGTRIRKCIYNALEKNPPEWAKKILEHSISKEVYKGNASGPTKKAVLSVLTTVSGGGLPEKPPKKGKKTKTEISISDIVMKQCRIVLRRAAATDDSKVFCNLLGRKLINSSDNDDEGLLGSPAMVARPLDFRTIDLRLAAGAYGGSHEAFVEDVRELWNNVRVAFGDQPDLVELAENLSHNFESLYNEEVVAYAQKFVEYAKLGCLSAEMRKEVDDFIASIREIPKAPWDEGVCKVCGVDRDDDSVLLCDTCDAEYHTYCLNPPLARIPEGNWYCPSCVDGKRAIQDVTERTHIICKRRKKRFRGEVSSLYLEALTHLSTVMEEKEYWDYSVGERTFLLKFLCDELLNSSLVRQHLEQCAEFSVELQQKLRAFSVEWKGLKAKEDILSTKSAKIDVCSLNTAGEVVHKEGFTATLISVANSDTDSQNMKSVDAGRQHRSISAAVESQCTHMAREMNSAGGADHPNHQKCEGRDISTLVTSQQGHCVPVDASQIAANEAKPYHVELNATKREISTLQDSITNVQSQLLKLSVRLEFLGTDSIGRLYWASTMPRGRSCIVADASDALLHRRGMTVNRDSVDKFSFMQHSALSSKDSSPLMSQPSNALGISSLWVVYETDAEIDDLLCWLKDNETKEKELKDSIMQWSKSRFHERSQTEDQVEDQRPFSIPGNREKIVSNSLVMKATSFLEKEYGPFFELDTIEVLKKRSKKARNTNDEKMYRCECLEPIWPSRKHCMSCHKTFESDVELERHNDGKCNASLLVLERNKDSSGYSKGRGNLKCGTSSKKIRGGADTDGTSINGGSTSKHSSSLIKFSNAGPSCPFNFEDICSKFVTNDSNKELVSEIGLIGSDGNLSFVPSVSPFVSDSTVMLFTTLKDDDNVVGGTSKASESQVSEGGTDGAGISTGRLATNESNEVGKCNTSLVEQRDGMSSFPSPMGVDGCCVVPLSSLRPLVGKVSHILRLLKISLLDMDASLPKVALKPSKAELDRRQAWRAFVKSAQTIYEMVQATITLEDMIKTEYLRNDWWYWSSFSAAAKSSTLSSLALRFYSLDSAIIYEKLPSSGVTDSSGPSSVVELKQQPATEDADKPRACRKSNRKRKESGG